VLGQPGVMCNPSLSPDDSRVAVDITDQQLNNVDVWLLGTKDAANMRFTFDPQEEVLGVWSRDGKEIAYRVNMTKGANLMVKAANGMGEARVVATSSPNDDLLPNSWTPDGKSILCTHQTSHGSYLELVSTTGGQPIRFHQGPGNQMTGMI